VDLQKVSRGDTEVADVIQCETHGESEKAYVCTHLVGETAGLGFNRRKVTKKNPFPDAWCGDCEIIRAAHNGWNEESEKLTQISLICSGCYERTRIRNTVPTVTLDDLAGLRWKCGSCEEWHTGPCLDFGYSRPYYWRKELENAYRWSFLPSGNLEKLSKSFLDEDYCAIDDEHFFVRGIIPLPILGAAEDLCWGVWGSLSRQNFETMLKTGDDANSADIPAIFSWLSTSIPEYPDTLSLKMHVHIQGPKLRPHFELEPSDHPLSQEFHHGISPERVREIMLGRLPAAE
jgi:hypothetical protein